jgi:hypothetical protein
MDISDEAYELANKRGEEMKRAFASAIAVVLSPSLDQLQIALNSGFVFDVPVKAFPELAGAESQQLRRVEISPSGFGIYFPDLDVDLYIPALLEQFGQANR